MGRALRCLSDGLERAAPKTARACFSPWRQCGAISANRSPGLHTHRHVGVVFFKKLLFFFIIFSTGFLLSFEYLSFFFWLHRRSTVYFNEFVIVIVHLITD